MSRSSDHKLYVQNRSALSPFDIQRQVEAAADERGHGLRTRNAGVGGFVGGILGSFGGPIGAAVGAGLGAFLGARMGDEVDQG